MDYQKEIEPLREECCDVWVSYMTAPEKPKKGHTPHKSHSSFFSSISVSAMVASFTPPTPILSPLALRRCSLLNYMFNY